MNEQPVIRVCVGVQQLLVAVAVLNEVGDRDQGVFGAEGLGVESELGDQLHREFNGLSEIGPTFFDDGHL